MARSVDEINISAFVNTGQTTPLARYTFTLEIKYTDNAGVKQVYGPTSQTFPNGLASMPLGARRRFAEAMITAVIRVELGIDTWEDYGG